MERLKISILFGSEPNFNKYAFKYFLLSLNKLQKTYEFSFPDINQDIFIGDVCEFSTAHEIINRFTVSNELSADHFVVINTIKFENNYFFNAENNTSVITTDIWEKRFSPPSLFEFLLHSIYCCLIYSQNVPLGREVPANIIGLEIGSHRDTRGCVADFTRDKVDDKVDIILGYICDQHKREISDYFGEDYLLETTTILERKWIGDIDVKNSVAYNLKHIYKFNINKDSGFDKTYKEKISEKLYDIPADLIGEILKIILTALFAYILIKLGISESKD